MTHHLSHLAGAITQNNSPCDPLVAKELPCTQPGDMVLIGDQSHLAGAMTQNYSPGDPLVVKDLLCTPPGIMALLGEPPPVTLSWGFNTELLTQ